MLKKIISVFLISAIFATSIAINVFSTEVSELPYGYLVPNDGLTESGIDS
jgi:hypothetical protein